MVLNLLIHRMKRTAPIGRNYLHYVLHVSIYIYTIFNATTYMLTDEPLVQESDIDCLGIITKIDAACRFKS
jgi:hypothetical protein